MANLLGRSTGRASHDVDWSHSSPMDPTRTMQKFVIRCPSGCIRLRARNLYVLFHGRLKATEFMSGVRLPHPPHPGCRPGVAAPRSTSIAHGAHGTATRGGTVMAQIEAPRRPEGPNRPPVLSSTCVLKTNTGRANHLLANRPGEPDQGRPDKPRITSSIEQQRGPLADSVLPPAGRPSR